MVVVTPTPTEVQGLDEDLEFGHLLNHWRDISAQIPGTCDNELTAQNHDHKVIPSPAKLFLDQDNNQDLQLIRTDPDLQLVRTGHELQLAETEHEVQLVRTEHEQEHELRLTQIEYEPQSPRTATVAPIDYVEFFPGEDHTRTCCACASSIFSGNDELVEFFLPKLGMACTCGKRSEIFPDPDLHADLTALEHILRPWQVEFLKSFGIYKGDQLVKAHHRSAGVLAKGMRNWRKKQGLTGVKTLSCGMALQIWSRTCKVYVRSVRRQLALGVEVIKPPNTLSVLSDILEKGDRRSNVLGRRRPKQRLIEVESQVEI